MRRQEREVMGREVLTSAGFTGIADDSVMICFLRKKGHFRFNNLHNLDVESRSQKVGSLKDFEIHDVPEKDLPHNGRKVINPFGMVICPK
jgi:hypothetical protein